jgi:hypothetical protein
MNSAPQPFTANADGANTASDNGESPDVKYGANLKRIEPWVNIFWIACGLAVCVYSLNLGLFGSGGPATGFFPMIAGVLLTATGSALLVTHSSRVDAAHHFWPEQGSARRVSMVMGGLMLMTLLMWFVGFIVAALIMMPVLLRAIEKRSWLFVTVVGSISTAAAYLLFNTLLGTLLPRSPWGF